MKKATLILIGVLCMVLPGKAQQKGLETSVEFNAGVGLDENIKYTFGINAIAGYRFNDLIFAGAGIGYSYLNGLYYTSYGNSSSYESYDVRSNLNVFARAKINMSKAKISPFVQLDLGGTFGIASNSVKMANGLMYEPGFGCDFKLKEQDNKVYVMLGYKGMKYQYTSFNLSYGNAGDETYKTTAGSFCFHLGYIF